LPDSEAITPGLQSEQTKKQLATKHASCNSLLMLLVVLHHHFRPGGVRRVIDLATPHLVTFLDGPFDGVLLAGGEEPDPLWFADFKKKLRGVPVSVFARPEFGYVSEMPGSENYAGRLRRAVLELIKQCAENGGLIWAHNLALGRNLRLARELSFFCHLTGIPLVLHHHDWWFENRWHHYSAFRESGFRSLTSIAQAILPNSWAIRFALVNRADARLMAKHFGKRAAWLPNPAERKNPPPIEQVQAARNWLTQQLGDSAPVWLMPCRLLRRKNIAEALLLARWLRPEAWLVTTGGASSAEEEGYAKALAAAANANGWRLRLGLLQGDLQSNPNVEQLIAASEVVLLTSVQEGFGLTYLEATAARRPLIARKLPNVGPDLAHFGFKFPYYYNDILIDPALFDWDAEYVRQKQLYSYWKKHLPRPASRLMCKPLLLTSGPGPRPVPFSRLTLEAQLEILTVPQAQSWEKCAPLNPFLVRWRKLASAGQLKSTDWPARADTLLESKAYAAAFLDLVQLLPPPKLKTTTSVDAQRDFLRVRLRSENLYPILWQNVS
jgi:hypothetical protein